MSDLETAPEQHELAPDRGRPEIEVLEPREVPLGGARAMTVRRTLPQRARSFIGGWCFADHYGPDPVTGPGTMTVPPHPHTGLQTVSWLFEGEVEHRDSVGSVALIAPGQVNLMTAGRGIQHSEVSTSIDGALHGVQLWVVLPEADREVAPFFEHADVPVQRLGDADLRVFVGALGDDAGPVTTFSRLLGAQLDLPAGGRVVIPVDAESEHGLLVDTGEPTIQGAAVATAHLGVVGAGCTELVIEAGTEPVRAILLGGRPLGEHIVMWWNFIGRDHDEVAAARADWQREVIDGGDLSGRFGHVADYPGDALPAPGLPNIRLRPRG